MGKEQIEKMIQDDEKWIQLLYKIDKGFLTKRIRQLELRVAAMKMMINWA